MKTHEENQITNAMTAIHKLKIEDWVRTFNEPNGFMFTNHENINKLIQLRTKVRQEIFSVLNPQQTKLLKQPPSLVSGSETPRSG